MFYLILPLSHRSSFSPLSLLFLFSFSKVLGPAFGDVMGSIVILKLACSLLSDLTGKVTKWGSNSIRLTLSKKVTHHILSQDLNDADKASKKGTKWFIF